MSSENPRQYGTAGAGRSILSRDQTQRPPSLAGCLEACRRCHQFLDALMADGESKRLSAYAVIGPHMRHTLDHFRCFLRGISDGVVDYDARERDPRIEREPSAFREAIREIESALEALDLDTLSSTLEIVQSASVSGRRASVTTTVERELVFLSGHSIHHLAIMSLLAERSGVAVPEDLSVAFSTDAYRTAKGLAGNG